MSPTYLKLFLAMLGLFSIATTAMPTDPPEVSPIPVSNNPSRVIDRVMQSSTSSFDEWSFSGFTVPSVAPTAVPSLAACAGASNDFTCPVGNATHFTASDCQDFVIECGIDRTGGDLSGSPQYPGSFAGCIDACASNEGCVACVYTDGPCYLKGELAATAELPGATGARKVTTLASATETTFSEPPVATVSVSVEPESWSTSLNEPVVVATSTTSVVLEVATGSVAVATVTVTTISG